jgi:hypothetical protein
MKVIRNRQGGGERIRNMGIGGGKVNARLMGIEEE